MSPRIEAPIQGQFTDITERRSEVSLIPAGTMVYPQWGLAGVVQDNLFANRLRKKVRGYTGFKARGPFTTFFDGRHQSFFAGTKFGMPVKNEHERTLPK